MAAYAYFDQNGNLLEFISDKSLRQGNENAGNQILVFMEPEDFNYAGKSLSCAYKDKNLDTIITDVIDVVQNIDTQVVPTFKDYDPTHFVSGKSYPFIVVTVPNLVLEDEGSKILSLALIELNDQNQEVSRMSYNSVITFYVDESVIQFTQTITKSEYEYLLAKIGEIAGEVIELSHIIYKVNSKSDLGAYTQWDLNQCFFVLSHEDYQNHPVLLKRGASGYELLFDLANYYTKSEIDSIRETLQNNINLKSTVVGEADANNAWRYLTIDGVRKVIGGSGGGGATYEAGYGISITGFTISADTTVLATKLDLEGYATTSAVSSLSGRVSTIEGLIPAQASSENQLADKNFVNSSIATSRATFRGTYNVVTDLGLTTSATHEQIASAIATKLASLSIVPDDNDYCYVAYPDATVSTQYTQFDEYKFNGTIWEYEFTLNNSSFTAEQWAAINSGITSGLLSQLARESEIADAYSNQATYSVNQYCIYNNTLYRCTTAVSTAEDFDSTKWTACKIADVMVDLYSNQTITGQKTILGKLIFKNSSPISDFSWYFIDNQFGDFELYRINTRQIYFNGSGIIPNENNTKDLGQSSRKWKEGFINKITDANGSYSSDNVFNVINASDITDNTLTQAQYDLITNGKPTLIEGTWGTITNGLITGVSSNNNFVWGNITGSVGALDCCLSSIYIAKSDNHIYLSSDTSGYLNLRGLAKLNGKTIPAYPTTNTSRQYLSIAPNGGALSYEYIEEVKTQSTGGATSIQLKTWVGTQAQYDSILTKDANTQYIII